ncbi:MAG: hypothetical protein KC486_08145 [Myxococcales bacterium]|nr:hypothetical protein [Myxococcales bacterium]
MLLGAALSFAPGAREAAASEPRESTEEKEEKEEEEKEEEKGEKEGKEGCDDESCVHGGHHKKHTRNLLGAKALMVSSLAETGTAPMSEHGDPEPGHVAAIHPGVVVFYERELIAEWLELELNVGMVSSHEGLRVPIDLLAKKPFHLAKRATLYLGVGPSLELFTDGQPPLGGVTGGLGSYLWFTRSFGVDVEIDYTAHFLLPGIEHVVTAGLGPVLHF